MMTKADTRKSLLAQRAVAHATEEFGPTETMARWLRSKMKPQSIFGTYNAIRTERNPEPLHSRISDTLAFPRVMGPNQALRFFLVSGPKDFEKGSFGVLEPHQSLPQVEPDIMLVPMVGFDLHGYRLGYGGGFYDRTLAKFRSTKPVFAVGFAYDGQLSDRPLNFEVTDLALDAILTPTRRFEFENGNCKETLWS